MTPYEGVLSLYLFAIKILHSSFAAIDDMDLETLAETITVFDKINDDTGKRLAFIDDIL